MPNFIKILRQLQQKELAWEAEHTAIRGILYKRIEIEEKWAPYEILQ